MKAEQGNTEAEDAALDAIEGTHEWHIRIDQPDEDCAACAEDIGQMWRQLMEPY